MGLDETSITSSPSQCFQSEPWFDSFRSRQQGLHYRIADGMMENYLRGRLYVLQTPSGDLLQVRRNAQLILDTDDEETMHGCDD